MKHISRSVSQMVLLAVLTTACGDSPTTQVEPVNTYDLLYESFVSGMVLVQPLAGGQPFAPLQAVQTGMDPAVSPDGRRIAYAVQIEAGVTRLMIADRLTGLVKPLTAGTDFDEQPSFSPDGKRIVFVSDRDSGDGGSDIYVMNIDGTDRRRLTTDPLPGTVFDRSPVWSPDGAQIVWSSTAGGPLQVWVMNADGSNKHGIVSGTAFQDDPVWSPDGARIAYFEVADLTPRMIVVNADGSNRTVLPTPANGVSRFPAWSPDGTLIAFTFLPKDLSRPQIFTMRIDGTELQQRTHDAQDRGGHRAVFIRRQ